MAKPVTLCAGCGTPLTFMSTPNFGGGRLKDGGRICRHCLARIVKVQPSFGLRSRKDHTTASMLQLLHPEPKKPEQNIQEQEQAQENYTPDPVPVLLDALQSGQDREGALAAAHQAHARWWALDCTDREYSQKELMELLDQRAFVLGSIATVYVWNKEFEIADRIQPEFIYNAKLWVDARREVVELYLIHLLFHEQYARVEAIFEDADFRKEFLDYYDLYRSVMDPHYEFQSKQDPFLASVNKVNHYCRQIGREHLF